MPHVLPGNPYLPVLRDRSTPTAEFRGAAHALAGIAMRELQKQLRASSIDASSIVIVIILRSAMTMLDAALRAFPSAPIAVVGLKRDEKTAVARWYYENFPLITLSQTVVILDPMLATGGSAEEAVLRLKDRGADPRKIRFVGIIAAPEGIARLVKHIPEGNIIVAAVDEKLDAKKFIVPGLGDFGDRYFGYGGGNVTASFLPSNPIHPLP